MMKIHTTTTTTTTTTRNTITRFVFFLSLWSLPVYGGVVLTPDGYSPHCSRCVHLLEFGYDLSCQGWPFVRRKKSFRKENDEIHKTISNFLDEQPDDYTWLRDEGGNNGALFLIPYLSRGFDREISVKIYPRSQSAYDDLLAMRPELRKKFKEELMDLFENNLQKKYKHLRLVSPPTKTPGFTYDLSLSLSSSSSSLLSREEISKRIASSDRYTSKSFYDNGFKPELAYAARLIRRAIHDEFQKQKIKISSSSSGMLSVGDDKVEVYAEFRKQKQNKSQNQNNNQRDLDLTRRIRTIAKATTAATAAEHKWFTVEFHPDEWDGEEEE